MRTLTVSLDETVALQLQALARLDGLSPTEVATAAVICLIQSRRLDPQVAERGAAIVAELDALFGEGWADLAASNVRHPSNGRGPQPPKGSCLQVVAGYL